nr:hypothetical protein [Tanacetum cinerariifolium]
MKNIFVFVIFVLVSFLALGCEDVRYQRQMMSQCAIGSTRYSATRTKYAKPIATIIWENIPQDIARTFILPNVNSLVIV